MAGPNRLNHPWLVAVWPGMGHVALNAGVYLLAKLGMSEFAEFEGGDTFDIEAVEVKGGLVQPGRRPRSRFFLWTDPNGRHDLLVFVGEAQPPGGKYTFCRRLVAFAKEQGVERVFTFAAMATRMHPEAQSRVFGAATDQPNLDELKRLELDILEDGNIGGLNGVLLSAAAEPEQPKRRSTARKRIEELFEEATRDRSKAFELKQELDRLGVFKEYEDRFLDLFKKAE